MFKEIEVGGKKLKFEANGTTVYRFKQIFNEDLIRLLNSDEINGTYAVDKIAFVMNRQAEKCDMNQQNFDKFLEWISEFEPLDLTVKADEILSVYTGDSKTDSKSKKKESQQIES